MSVLLCPRATRPLLGFTVRSVPSKTSKAPSLDTLRWLSRSVCGDTRIPPRTSRCLNVPCRSIKILGRPSGSRRTISFFSRGLPQRYEDLPEDYLDEDGLSFRSTELSQEETDKVFGKGRIDADAANNLLKILHGRRVAGTLEDPAFWRNTRRYNEHQISAALAYLRVTLPVDEALNAGLRAEDELAQLEEEAREQSEEGAASKSPQEETKKPSSAFYKPDPVYGESAFDKIRAKNQERQRIRDEEMEKQKLERQAKLEAEAAKAGPVALVTDEGKKIMSPKLAEYYKKAQQEGLEEPEMVSFWQRVLPSLTFVTLTLGFLVAVTTVYEEPVDKYRMLSFMSTAQATVCTLIGVNVLVWLGWKMPPLWSFFNRYMLFVVGAVKPITLFTANFSHHSLSHLLTNMVPLYFVGAALHEELGRATFLTLYAACGAMGYLGSLTTYTLRGWLSISSHGASAGTLGVMAAYFWAHRMDGFKFLGLPEDGVHGIVFLALLLAMQLQYFGKSFKSKIDLASHLTGMATGLVGAEVIARSRAARQEQMQQQRRQSNLLQVTGPPAAGEQPKAHIEVLRWVQNDRKTSPAKDEEKR